MNMNDNDIIIKVLEGEIENYDLLIKKYSKNTYNFICSIVKNEHMAEELTQITFIKAYENINKFNLSKNFFTWILTIAKNSTINELRKNKKQCELNNFYLDDYYSSTILKFNPEKIYADKSNNLKLYNFINSLSYKYKVLIILKYIQNLSYKEISKELNIPISKVESRLFTARKKLINKIEKNDIKEKGGDLKWIAKYRKI
ncbi:MAG: RNA polymerase sigma factor [Clostridium sp.]|uniref:RNA polymerase sigma factor n=1 Tax=Clostridium sp. TaxID=1506 RepID=UPI003D6D9AB2